MTGDEEIILTQEGHDRICAELQHLSTVERPEVRKRLSEAKQSAEDFDTSEYENAKMDQAIIESRIGELEDVVRRATILKPDDIPTKEVGLGSIVRLKDRDVEDVWEVRIVSSFEADPNENRISIESPLGRALLGQKARADVEVKAPAGMVKYRVLKIGR
jgi:transcription elongation factor GreA